MREAGRLSRPRPRQMGTEESYKRQAAYIRIDTLQVRGHRAANSATPAPGETRSPAGRGCICAYSPTAATCAPPGPAALGRTGQRRRPRVRPLLPLGGALPPPPAAEPASSSAVASPVGPRWERAVGARVRGSAGCEAVCDGRECARGRVHERCARHLTLRSPEPAPRTRTGPLQLPRAMILWKQKLKVGRNNGGPIGCNLGPARTC